MGEIFLKIENRIDILEVITGAKSSLFSCKIVFPFIPALAKKRATAFFMEPGEAVYVNDPQVGAFLKTKVFAAGKARRWDEVTRAATGADLGPEAFARRFEGL